MIIEVTGTSTWNKGAELMLVAIREHFEPWYPDVQLAVDQHFGNYAERAQYGLLQKANIKRFGRSQIALTLMPASFRKSYGLVVDRDISAVLDAAGFAFGDQHPAQRSIVFAREVEAWKKQGKTIILLPQALGPFEQSSTRDAFARIAAAADLIYARDVISLEHAQKAANGVGRIELAPDFTNLVKPALRQQSDASQVVSIVPNQRMIEKAPTKKDAAAYIPFLAQCIRIVNAAGLHARLLIHGDHDMVLVDGICETVGYDLPLVREEDPVRIKQLLGESHLVIGSRFHALVSALSQGVPCIGTSWSHKYEMLFQDYGCEEMMLSIHANQEEVQDRIERAVGKDRILVTKTIRDRSVDIQSKVQAMWGQVEQLLGLEPQGAKQVHEDSKVSVHA